MERVSRLVDREVLQAMLRGVQVDLSRRDTAEASAEALEAAIGGGFAVAPHFDQKTERYQVRIERTRHGNVRMSTIDTEFVRLRRLRADPPDRGDAARPDRRGASVHARRQAPAGARLREAMKWLLGEVEAR